MDGFEATREIRKMDGEIKNIPVIALTAAVRDEDKEMCFLSGMNDYMSKPISQNTLSAKLRKWSQPNISSGDDVTFN